MKVIFWESLGDHTGYVYRLEDDADWERLRRDLRANAESDGRETITVKEYSESEWAEVSFACDDEIVVDPSNPTELF